MSPSFVGTNQYRLVSTCRRATTDTSLNLFRIRQSTVDVYRIAENNMLQICEKYIRICIDMCPIKSGLSFARPTGWEEKTVALSRFVVTQRVTNVTKVTRYNLLVIITSNVTRVLGPRYKRYYTVTP